MLIKYLILAILLLTSRVIFPQFDEVIFNHNFSGVHLGSKVVGLGDQNNDGLDDILVYDGLEKRAKIFFGGNPMDTLPALELSTGMQAIDIADINHNGYGDLVISQFIQSYGLKVNIYWGGTLLDTIPDIIFPRPAGASDGFGLEVFSLNNFDGTNIPTLVITDINLPNSNQDLGTNYFYNTYPELDTIPFAIIKGDPNEGQNGYRAWGIIDIGDLNGDELTDFAIVKSPAGGTGEPLRREIYLGNASWDLTPQIIYKQEEHSFDINRIWTIEDINKDGRDDILAEDYTEVYPFWYNLAIWYGSIPIDTIPDHGINGQNSTVVNKTLICSPGDVNGDTFNDLILGIGNPASLRLWLGSRLMNNDPDMSWERGVEYWGRLISRVGDVDGDQVDDICIGFTDNFNFPHKDLMYIIKGDTSVKIDTGTVSVESEEIIPQYFEIKQNYPNPFNPSTKIKFTIPNNVIASGTRQSLVTLKVYDVLGNEIATLVNEEKSAGEYEVEFNGTKLTSGIYFYKLQAGGFVEIKKMVLLK